MHLQLNESQPENETDGFDRLPDSLILLVLNSVSDIKSLIRCRAVSKRFNSLVPEAESLILKVDRVIPTETEDSFLITFLKSIVKSVNEFISPKSLPIQTRPQNSPTQILRGFERIRSLEIELPAGDLRLEKGAIIRWKAEFGKSLKSCVILGIRAIRENGDSVTTGGENEDEIDFAGDEAGNGLKMRVVWTISALIAASARHYMLKDVINEHREMERLVVRDREGEGTVLMNKEGLMECRGEQEARAGLDKSRTTVPAVRMRMRHAPALELKGGVRVEGATLVVVRPTSKGGGSGCKRGTSEEVEEVKEDGGLAFGMFEGVFGEALQALLKNRSYLLEMNSF